MYIGEQIINPTDDRILLSKQLGCDNVVVDSRPGTELEGEDGTWDARKSVHCAIRQRPSRLFAC